VLYEAAIRCSGASRLHAAPDGLSDDPEKSLLDSLAGLAGERALILGLNIEIMCGLIQRGCREVTEMERDDHPEAGSVELVVVPAVASEAAAERAVALARRGLTNFGRIVMRTARSPSAALRAAVLDSLRRHRFFLTDVCTSMDRTAYVATLVRRGQ
jgi:hypothetical protein